MVIFFFTFNVIIIKSWYVKGMNRKGKNNGRRKNVQSKVVVFYNNFEFDLFNIGDESVWFGKGEH